MNGANKITKLVLSLLMTISCINFSTVQAEDSEPAATSIPAEEVIAEPTPTTEGSTDEVLPAASPAAEVTAVPELVEDENSDPVPTAAAGTEGEGTVVPAPVPTEEPGVEQQEEAVKDYSENILFDANTDITYNEDYTVAFVTMKLDTAEDMHLYFANEEEAIQNNEFVSVDTEKTSADKKLWVLDITKNGEYTLDAQARNNETSEVLGTKQITFTVTDIAEKVAEPVKSAPVLRAPSAVISEEPTVASEVQLNEFYIVAEKNLITVGQTMNITAHFDPADYENQAVTWQSADSSIATVDENGKVTAIAEGNVRVTATAQANTDFTDSVTISVDPVKVNKIAISGYSKEYMTPGETVTLTYTVSPDNAEDKTVVWSSLNEDVVTVNQSGLVTAIGSGTTTVRATNPLTGIYSEQSITVYDATPVTQTVYVWVTNQYQNTSYTFNIPKDGTEVTPSQVARNSTGTQGTLVTKAEFRVGDFTSGSNWGSIQSNGLVEAFRYNTSSKKVQYKLAGSDWANLDKKKVYDFSVVKYTSSDVTVNDTDVAVSVGDWPYTGAKDKLDHQLKTIQIIIHNNETNTDVYNSGKLHYDNNSNGNYGKINFNCNQSKYKVTQVEVTKNDKVINTYTEGSIPEDLEVKFNGKSSGTETYVIKATIAAKTIHVTYSSEGTVTNMPKATTTKTTGTVDVSDQVPVRDGYIFTGWAYVDGGATTIYHGGDSFDAPIHDVELRAQWLKMSDQINYVVNDPAMGTVSRSYERVGGTSGKPAKGSVARAKEGYRFVHWIDADNNEVSKDALYVPTSTEAATYTAVFEALNSNLIIHYTDDKGNKIREDDTKEYAYGAKWTEEAPEIQGYKRPSDTTKSGVKNNTTEEITFVYTQKKGKVVYNLSDKGSWDNGTPDQVQVFDASKGKWAYTYGFDKDDTFVVTDKIPVSSDNAAFVGWYDKKRGSQPAAMRTAGQTLTYPYTESSAINTYTLDALWETLHGEDKTVTYDGESHSLDEFTAQFANENLGEWTDSASSLVALESLQYRVKNTDGTYSDWGTMPSFKDVGVYTIQAQAVVNGVTLTSEATLTINKRSVTLTSAGDSKTYDTTPLTKHVVDITEDGFANGEGADYQFTGSQTEVGSSANTFTYTLKSNTLRDNYNIEVHYGTLKVTPVEKEITVTITGNTATETYTGNTYSVEGYKVTGVSDVLYAKENVEFTGIARAEGTEAGTYYMNLNVAQFTNNSANFTNVKFVVTDGYLTINPKSIEDEDSGIAVTNPEDTMYNGTSQKLEPTVYDSKTNTLLVKDKDYYLDYSKDTTNAGEVAIIVKGKGNYSGSKSASYKITPRAVILTSEDASRPYDGTPLTRPTVAMTGDGFVKGEVEDIKATGTITNVGSVDNTITYTRLDKFKESNYIITEEKGKLIIEARRVTVTAKNSGKVFGEADPELEAEVRGVVTGESVDLIKYTVSRKPGETVGDYPITVSGNEKQGNYVVTYTPATFTITKSGELTLTADLTGEAATKVYDGKPLTGGAKASVTEGTTITYSTDGENWTTEVPSITDVGTLDVTARAENPNYDPVETTYTLTVTPKEVTVTTPSTDKVYDGTALTAEGTITGLENGETVTFTTTGSQTTVGTSDNTYTLVFDKTAKEGNYSIDDDIGKLTVREQSIDPEDPDYSGISIDEPIDVTYDGEEHKWSPTVTDKENTALVENVDYTVSYNTENFIDVQTIVVTIKGTGNYSGTVTRTYRITPATVTVTANDDSKVFGEADPDFTATVTGLVVKDEGKVTIDYTIDRDGGEDVGKYTITPMGAMTQGNYIVEYATGTFEITPRSIKPDTPETPEEEKTGIKVNNASDSIYNGEEHKFIPEITNKDGITLVDGKDYEVSYSTDDFTNVTGEIVVTIKGKGNYTGEFTDHYQITKRYVRLSSLDDGKEYDGTPLTNTVLQQDSALTFVEGEASAEVTGTITNKGSVPNTITVIKTEKYKEDNYDFATDEGTLTITAKEVTVTANNANKVYGENDPELKATVTGTLNNNKVDYTLTREPGEDVGTYVINVTGDEDQGNYHVTYTAGEFEITKSGELKLTAELTGESATKVYDGTPLTGGATASVKEGTTITYSTDGENWTTEVPGITNVGELSVTAKAENPNYEPTETTYSLTVTHATATVTAEDKTKTYGEADPAFTAKVEGIIAIEKDTVHIAYDQPLTRDPGEAKGTYTIHVTGETTQGNYHVEYVAGTLEITSKSLEDEDNGIEVTNPDDTIYDGTSQKLKPTVVDIQTNATLTEGTDYYLDYSADTTNVGTVAIMIKGTGNYSGSKAASYKITPRPYTVTTESASKTYDGKALTAGGSYDGIVEGETVIVHTTGTQTEVGSSANTYTLEWKDCSKENYTLAGENIGTLTVTQQTIDPEDPDPEKEYLGVTVDTPSDVTYDGNEHKWTPTVLDAGDKALTEGTDYTVSYDTEDFTNVHTITVTIEGIGNYTGTVVRTYAITPAEVTVTANNTGKVYGEADPELTAKVEGTIGNDKVLYKLERDPGEDVGTYVIHVTGVEDQGNYRVTYTAGEFEITPKSIIPVTPEEPGEDANITVETLEDVKYNGESQQQKPVIKDDKGNVLEEGKDYTLEFCEDTTNAGTVTVTVTGINNYEGTFDVQYNILPRDITMTSGNAEKVYDGTALTNGEIVITGDGFVEGEGVTYNVTGTQTEVGSSANTFDYAFNENTLASNYKVTTVNGTLTVTPQTVVPVTPPQPPVNPGPEVTPQDTPTTAEVQTPTTTITEQKTPQTAPKKTETIKNDPTPEAAGKAYWALINLICAAVTVVLAIFALLSKHKKEDAKEDEDTDAQTVMSTEEDEEDPEISRRHRIWKVVGAVDAIVAVIVFFLTENMSLPMALTDKWTVLMVVFALISVVTTVLAKKWHKKDDDNAENNEEQNTLQNA